MKQVHVAHDSDACAGRGEKRSRPPSPSRPERPEPGRDGGGPRADPVVANGRPLPDDPRGAKRLAVNLLPDNAGRAPARGADRDGDRGRDVSKRSRSPQDAMPAAFGADTAEPPGLSPGSSHGTSPAAAAAQTRPHAAAAAGSSANGNTGAAKGGGSDTGRRGNSPPSAPGVPAASCI